MNKILYIACSFLLYCSLREVVADVKLKMDCGESDAVTCKKVFIEQLDFGFQEFHLKTFRKEIDDMTKVFEGVLSEIPKEDDPRWKMFSTAIAELQADLKKLEVHRNDYNKTRELINHVEWNMQPQEMANLDKKSLADLEKILDKHNYTKIMQNFDFHEFTHALKEMWFDLFLCLRRIDVMTYPEYVEIKDRLRTANDENDVAKKDELVRRAVRRLRQFFKVPFLEEIIFHKDKPKMK